MKDALGLSGSPELGPLWGSSTSADIFISSWLCPYFPAMCLFRGVPWGPQIIRISLSTQTAQASLVYMVTRFQTVCRPQPIGCPAPPAASLSSHPPPTGLTQDKATPAQARRMEGASSLLSFPWSHIHPVPGGAPLKPGPDHVTPCSEPARGPPLLPRPGTAEAAWGPI